MAQPDPAAHITVRMLLREGRVTNWPARTMVGAAIMVVVSVIFVVVAFLRRDHIPNWYEVALFFGVLAVVGLFWAPYCYRKARWYHYVQTTLDPTNKEGL